MCAGCMTSVLLLYTAALDPIGKLKTMEELKWSGTGGLIVLRRLAGVPCVHYIEQKDCTARFATEAIREILIRNLNQVASATHPGSPL